MPNRREARRTARAGSSHVRPAQVELVLCASSKRTEVQYIVLNYHLMLAGVLCRRSSIFTGAVLSDDG
jgi:hypothetical protein